jgi:hypothetical protein
LKAWDSSLLYGEERHTQRAEERAAKW